MSVKAPVCSFKVVEFCSEANVFVAKCLTHFYIALIVATFSNKASQHVTSTQVGNCFDVLLRNSEGITSMNQLFFKSNSCEAFQTCVHNC